PKTAAAERWVELFPETVRLLAALQPLRVTPTQPVFTTTEGQPIEPKAFASRYWYRGLRALQLRVRGIYATKDTFVTTALQVGVKVAWLEAQTGVAYATLKRHYGRWITLKGESELARFASLAPTLFGTEEGDEIVPSGCRERDNSRQAADPASKSQCEEGDLKPSVATSRLKKRGASGHERASADMNCPSKGQFAGCHSRVPSYAEVARLVATVRPASRAPSPSPVERPLATVAAREDPVQTRTRGGRTA